jgi:hypothetical protein
MKILKTGKNLNELIYRKTCGVCNTSFEFTGGEVTEMNFIKDKRKHGTVQAVVVIQCPNCTAPVEADVEDGNASEGCGGLMRTVQCLILTSEDKKFQGPTSLNSFGLTHTQMATPAMILYVDHRGNSRILKNRYGPNSN